jgi:hypothetical protein
MKDNGEEHFEFVHHNVSAIDMNEGKIEYAKFGEISSNNYITKGSSMCTFSYVEVFGCYSCHDALSHVQKWQLYPKPTRVIPSRSTSMDVRIVFV